MSDDSSEDLTRYWNEFLLSALFGLPDTDIRRNLLESSHQQLQSMQAETQQMIEESQQLLDRASASLSASIPITGMVHYLEETDTEEQGPTKRLHLSPSILIPKQVIGYCYLKLSSHEYRFGDDDGKELLLTPTLEPNVYIRKLIGILPSSIRGRLEFLQRFLRDEDNEVIEVDMMESNEMISPCQQLQRSTIFTNLREQLFTAYLMEMKLRRIFRGILQRWRIRQIHKKEITNLDPITLVEPIKRVEVYDIKAKMCYRFDATSLATWIESNLNYHEAGFALPMNPRNPWTNIDFTETQLISIYYQLKEHGELRWALTTLREQQFSKSKWERYHHSLLTMRAIRNSLTQLDSYDARELLEDFIYSKMDDLHIYTNSYIQQAYRQAILRVPRHWYIEEFKHIAFQHYEALHFNQNRYRMIHNRCDRIFRKQSQFLQELRDQGIIGPVPPQFAII